MKFTSWNMHISCPSAFGHNLNHVAVTGLILFTKCRTAKLRKPSSQHLSADSKKVFLQKLIHDAGWLTKQFSIPNLKCRLQHILSLGLRLPMTVKRVVIWSGYKPSVIATCTRFSTVRLNLTFPRRLVVVSTAKRKIMSCKMKG